MPSSTMIPPDQEPEDVVVDAVRETVTKWWRRLIDWGRTWSTAKLAAIAVTGLVSLIGAAVALPWAASAGCTIVVVLSLVLAVAARRLMFVERARRRWQEVGLIRM